MDIQLRRITEGLTGMAGLSEPVLSQSVQSLQGLPQPGALFAAQLNLLASSAAFLPVAGMPERGQRAAMSFQPREQIEFGMVTSRAGIPVAVRVFSGNTSDSAS